MPEQAKFDDPRLRAAFDLLPRTGATEVQIRYDDVQDPIVWVACARWGDAWEGAGGMNPLRAVMRLLEAAMDGGQCAFCAKPAGVSEDWEADFPLSDLVCWWLYDPETKSFRRSCEGEHDEKQVQAQVVGRNDPCPCGSGKKFKRCCR